MILSDLRNLMWVTAVTAGAYIATSAIAAATALLVAQIGLSRPDAVVIATLLSFVNFTVLSIWAFQMKSARQAWAALAAVTTIAGGIIWLLAKA